MRLVCAADLDVQYASACSPSGGGVPPLEFRHLTGDDPLVSLVEQLANDNNPPPVVSISYGGAEAHVVNHSAARRFDIEVMLLSVQGVTIVAASGDSGANGKSTCGYDPVWPATSPWVTAVGATYLEQLSYQSDPLAAAGFYRAVGTPDLLSRTSARAFSLSSVRGYNVIPTEHAVDANQAGKGLTFSTGGGFSTLYTAPPWQEAVTDAYLFDSSPVDGFNRAGRGYPDLTMVGSRLLVVINEQLYLASGTSASAPIFAALAARVNLVRSAEGRPPMGSLNPMLYHAREHWLAIAQQMGGQLPFYDVAIGANKCPEVERCCSTGFEAAIGWDPVNGLGSVTAESLYSISVACNIPLNKSVGEFDAFTANSPTKEDVDAFTAGVSHTSCEISPTPPASSNATQVLLALYDATAGNEWKDNTNWLSGNPCTWKGVSCNGGIVTRV